MIEQAEDVLRDLGLPRLPRAAPRYGRAARDRPRRNGRARSTRGRRAARSRASKALGYQHVTIDLQGYRLGSLNEALRLRPVS